MSNQNVLKIKLHLIYTNISTTILSEIKIKIDFSYTSTFFFFGVLCRVFPIIKKKLVKLRKVTFRVNKLKKKHTNRYKTNTFSASLKI